MNDLQTKLRYLRNTPLFKSLTDDELQQILQAPENGIQEYASKETVIMEDEIGNCMYIILEGSVEVMIQGTGDRKVDISLAVLREGDFFGEKALLPGSTGKRNASVKTIHPTKVIKIDKKYVLLSIKRDTREVEIDKGAEDATVAKRNEIKQKFGPDEVRDTIMNLDLFRSLNTDELKNIRQWAKVVDVDPGEFVIKEAQKGEHMYVVLEGTVEIFILDDNGKIVVLAELKHGDYFGEKALMPDSKGKRNAFARTDDKSRLILIPKEFFRLMLKRDSQLAKSLEKRHKKHHQERKNI